MLEALGAQLLLSVLLGELRGVCVRGGGAADAEVRQETPSLGRARWVPRAPRLQVLEALSPWGCPGLLTTITRKVVSVVPFLFLSFREVL